jgi:hypothetical protein
MALGSNFVIFQRRKQKKLKLSILFHQFTLGTEGVSGSCQKRQTAFVAQKKTWHDIVQNFNRIDSEDI